MADRQIPEMNYLMSLVEKKFHKDVKTSTDFYSLAQEIETETGNGVSASTLKRMWGYVSTTSTARQATLDILAKYIGKKNYKTFCEDLKSGNAFQSIFFTAEFINASDLKVGDRIEIGWDPDRLVVLKYLGDSAFEVETAINSKLEPGDRFVQSNFIKGYPLYISRIQRGDKYTASYVAGRQGGINHLKAI